MHIGGHKRSFRVGFVLQEKGANSSNDAEDKFKDDKFKDDPDVRGILSDIKSHFDKEVNVPSEPNEESVANEDEDKSDINAGEESIGKNTKDEGGSVGAKNMKDLLEKIYGARTKAAAEKSVGNDPLVGFISITDAISRRLYGVPRCRLQSDS